MNTIYSALMGIIQKIIVWVISLMVSAGTIVPPATDNPIKAKNPDEVRLTFTVTADTQVNAFNTNRIYLDSLLADMANAETRQDALVIAGDITENSLVEEWDVTYGLLGQYDAADNYVMATGNHDIRLRSHSQAVERFTSYYNDFTGSSIDDLHYSMKVNGYTFVVVGSDEQSLEKQIIHDEQLKWLDETLAEAVSDGDPVFVVIHQPIKKTHGLPALWNNGVGDSGHIGKQSDAVYEIMNKYDNVIMISGHLHTGFGQYTYQEVGNIHSINLPSVGKKNADGEYCEFSIGFTCEVYDDEVIFRARDFGKGVYVPEYDIEIPLV